MAFNPCWIFPYGIPLTAAAYSASAHSAFLGIIDRWRLFSMSKPFSVDLVSFKIGATSLFPAANAAALLSNNHPSFNPSLASASPFILLVVLTMA